MLNWTGGGGGGGTELEFDRGGGTELEFDWGGGTELEFDWAGGELKFDWVNALPDSYFLLSTKTGFD